MKGAKKKVAKKAAGKTARKSARKAAAGKPAGKSAKAPAAGKPVAARAPLTGNGRPVTWNFKLLSHHMLDGLAAWAKACRSRSHPTAAVSCGWRTRARRRISPPSTCPTRASPRWSCRPTCRRPTCAPTRWRPAETSWRSRTRRRERGYSRPAWSCSTSPFRKIRGRSRSSTAPDRPRAACISCGSATGSMSTARPARRISCRRIPATTSSTAASTCAIPRGRWRSAAGGCPAPARATT